MKTKWIAIIAVAVVGTAFSSANAQQQQDSFITKFKTDYHRNKLWPTPFRSQDTIAVQTALDVQRNNGWRLYNTLGTPMFDSASQKLTDAGKTHVRWIVTNAPPSRRVIFVLKGANSQQTAQRIEATQLAVSEILPVGDLPQIYVTDVEPSGSSGVYQTAVHRAMIESMPSPRLPAASQGTGTP